MAPTLDSWTLRDYGFQEGATGNWAPGHGT